MKNRFLVLGAGDPEMAAIEQLCIENGLPYTHAFRDGKRVHPGNAYNADSPHLAGYHHCELVFVECGMAGYDGRAIKIDHHHPGDPGYGAQPSNFWEGSSIGQFCNLFGLNGSEELMLTAAADHCLSHAYRGRCPGVDPGRLKAWRIKSRASFQRVPESTMSAAIDHAVSAIEACPLVTLNGHQFIDGRGVNPREFSEATAIVGKPVIYEIYDHKSRRVKGGVLGGEYSEVSAWMEWASTTYVDIYGDPVRGYAGGYKPV